MPNISWNKRARGCNEHVVEADRLLGDLIWQLQGDVVDQISEAPENDQKRLDWAELVKQLQAAQHRLRELAF